MCRRRDLLEREGDRIDPKNCRGALDEPPSTATTLRVIADYNQTPEQE